MTKADRQVVTELEAVLTSQEYSPVVVRNYCAYARGFAPHSSALFQSVSSQASRLASRFHDGG